MRDNSMGRNEEPVALRKESVDRNRVFYWLKVTEAESLSARRAWIEMSSSIIVIERCNRRSPQGERG